MGGSSSESSQCFGIQLIGYCIIEEGSMDAPQTIIFFTQSPQYSQTLRSLFENSCKICRIIFPHSQKFFCIIFWHTQYFFKKFDIIRDICFFNVVIKCFEITQWLCIMHDFAWDKVMSKESFKYSITISFHQWLIISRLVKYFIQSPSSQSNTFTYYFVECKHNRRPKDPWWFFPQFPSFGKAGKSYCS